MAQEEQVKSLVEETVKRYGKLDIVVNAAAIVPFKEWDEIDFAEWRRIMAVNLDGTFLLTHYAQRPMREAGYGRIINIASNVIVAGTPNLAHYVASKGGVFASRGRLARELGKYGITVNSVAPGLTASEGVLASPHAEAFEFVQMLQAIPRRGEVGRHRPDGRVPRVRGGALGDRPDDRGGRRPHAQLMAGRAGAILAVARRRATRSRSIATGSASRWRRSTTIRRTPRSSSPARGSRWPSRAMPRTTGRASR